MTEDTRMLSCEEVLTQLWEYMDGELTQERTELIRVHLEMCKRCYPSYDFQRAFQIFLRRQAERPAPPGLRRRIFERLLREDARGA